MEVNLERKWGSTKMGQAATNAGYALRVLGKKGFVPWPSRDSWHLIQMEIKAATGQRPSILATEAQAQHLWESYSLQTYGSSLERLVTYINVPWLPSCPKQVEIRHIHNMTNLNMISRDRNYILNTTHILSTWGRWALLHNNTRWKQYTKWSHSLSQLRQLWDKR